MKNDAMKNAPAGENERPLMLAPAFKDYIWGGERLKRDWGKQTDLSPLAESWELSCHEAGPSVVASGEWAGRTLAQVLAAHPQFVGTKAEKAGEFPLLIKLIAAAGPLSVQVHPDDDYAERVERLHRGAVSSRLTADVANYVQHHLSDAIKTEQIARALYVSRPYLSKKFRESTGETLTDFILKEKTEEAKRLLRYSDKSLTAIGSYLGFSSPSHFSRIFRKYAGSSPHEYRERYN